MRKLIPLDANIQDFMSSYSFKVDLPLFKASILEDLNNYTDDSDIKAFVNWYFVDCLLASQFSMLPPAVDIIKKLMHLFKSRHISIDNGFVLDVIGSMSVINKLANKLGMPGIMASEDLAYLAENIKNGLSKKTGIDRLLLCGLSGTVMPLLLSSALGSNKNAFSVYEINNYAIKGAELPYALETISGITATAFCDDLQPPLAIIAFGISDTDLISCAFRHDVLGVATLLLVNLTSDKEKPMKVNYLPGTQTNCTFTADNFICKPLLINPKSLFTYINDNCFSFGDKLINEATLNIVQEKVALSYTPVITTVKLNSETIRPDAQLRDEAYRQAVDDSMPAMQRAYLAYQQRATYLQLSQQSPQQAINNSTDAQAAQAALTGMTLQSVYSSEVRDGANADGFANGVIVFNRHDSCLYMVTPDSNSAGLVFRRLVNVNTD